MELTVNFLELLEAFAPVFTTLSFATFRLLMTGWILSVRHRYVTDSIISSQCSAMRNAMLWPGAVSPPLLP